MTGDGAFGQLGLGQNVRYAARPVRLQGALASHQVCITMAPCHLVCTFSNTQPSEMSPK